MIKDNKGDIQSSTTSNTSNNTNNNTNKPDKERIIINDQRDLLKLPITKLINNNVKIDINGNYYNKILTDVINQLEKRQIKEIKVTQKLFKPEIERIQFKVACSTQFGEDIKITGDTEFLGKWSTFKQLKYNNGFWIFEINRDTEGNPLRLNSVNNSTENSLKSSFTESNVNIKNNKKDICNNTNTNGVTNNEDYKSYFNNNNLEFEYKFIINNANNGNVIWESTANRKFNYRDIKEQVEICVFSKQNLRSSNVKGSNTCTNLMQIKSGNGEKVNSNSNKQINSCMLDSIKSLNSNYCDSDGNDVHVNVEISKYINVDYYSKTKLLVYNLQFNSL